MTGVSVEHSVHTPFFHGTPLKANVLYSTFSRKHICAFVSSGYGYQRVSRMAFRDFKRHFERMGNMSTWHLSTMKNDGGEVEYLLSTQNNIWRRTRKLKDFAWSTKRLLPLQLLHTPLAKIYPTLINIYSYSGRCKIPPRTYCMIPSLNTE